MAKIDRNIQRALVSATILARENAMSNRSSVFVSRRTGRNCLQNAFCCMLCNAVEASASLFSKSMGEGGIYCGYGSNAQMKKKMLSC